MERVVDAGQVEQPPEHRLPGVARVLPEQGHRVDRAGGPAARLQGVGAGPGHHVVALAERAGDQQRVRHRPAPAQAPWRGPAAPPVPGAASERYQSAYRRTPSAKLVRGDQPSSRLACAAEIRRPA